MTYYSRSTSKSPLEIEDSTIPELYIIKSYRAGGVFYVVKKGNKMNYQGIRF